MRRQKGRNGADKVRLRPVEIILWACFLGSYFSPFSQIISLVSVHPVIDPRHEAQMGPSRAKQQRQHPPLLESVWGHTLLLVKCVVFAALHVLPVNPFDASVLRQFEFGFRLHHFSQFPWDSEKRTERLYRPALWEQYAIGPCPSVYRVFQTVSGLSTLQMVGRELSCTSGFCKILSGQHLH